MDDPVAEGVEVTLELYLKDGEEIAITSNTKPICDGGGPLGHPREFLVLPKGGETICKYCDRRYVHSSHADAEKIRQTGEAFAAS